MPDEEACAAIAALMDEDKSKMNRRLQELYELVGTGNLDERRRSIAERALEKIRALPSLNETVFGASESSMKVRTEIVKIRDDQMIVNVRDVLIFEALLLEAEVKEQQLLDGIKYLEGIRRP